MGSPQEAVQIVLVVQEAMQFFRYYAIMDDRTCEKCLRFDGMLMTRREIYSRFGDYLEKESDWVWYPQVHINCRCELRWEEESES